MKKKYKDYSQPKMANIRQKWLALISLFANDYSKKYTSSEIARAGGIPERTCTRLLNIMVKQKRAGKNG